MAKTVNELGTELCAAMALDPNLVTGISFRWKPGTLATITVEIMATEPLLAILKKYKFVEITESNG